MANPPFAGDIKEPRMISRYDLAKKPNGKWQTKVGRDILFIERNLDFLKPGGRMAIVLPQGRFNNSSDKNIRDFIAERCRILAVVGLHGNTFKPHTGTKTSVLFVQKWNDDSKVGALCPRRDDYNIFFATMQKSGKDNSGEKIYRRIVPQDEEGLPEKEKERQFLLDPHDHLIVDHDLYNHEGLTEDGIAEAFIEFAKKEQLSFFEPSPSVTPFDAVKYQRLMDGLEAVELNLTDVLEDNELLRIDSEYFKTEYLAKLKRIKKLLYRKIQEVAYVTDGIHESIEFDEDSSINLISAQSPKENIFDLSGNDCISPEQHKKNPRTTLQKGDVIISTVGTVGNCAVVDETILPANSDRHVGIVRLEKDFQPHFLSTFLLSKYGRFQTIRESTGNVQLNLFIYKIKTLKIPFLSSKFQGQVAQLIQTAHLFLNQSKTIYQQAEDLLLSELGLQDWQPTEETVAVKSFAESFLACDRLDAEYYQPKQQKVMAIMRQSGLCIGDVAPLVKRKFQPDKQGEFNYIEIGNLSGEGFANGEVVAMDEAPSRAQWIVKPNDVVTSTVRPIRRLSALIEPEQNNYICSSGFAVLKPTQIEPEVLLVYLRSPIVCEILDLHTTASMYPAISTEDLLNIPITLPKESTRQKITEKVRESRKAQEQSKQLLEIAKTGVERAIETDEATAIAWINEQLEVLNIKLT
jgi:type I restriction enzyme M protein